MSTNVQSLSAPPKPSRGLFPTKVQLTIPPSHMLTPHWHPNSTEIAICISGDATVTIFSPAKNAAGVAKNEYTFNTGQEVELPQGYLHYFVNIGQQNLVMDLTFENPDFDLLSIAETWPLLPEFVQKAVENSDNSGDASGLIIPYTV